MVFSCLVDADFLVMLGQVEGLFTADPNVDAEAKLIEVVETLDDDVTALGGGSWDGRGQGGMATKLDAARLALSSGGLLAVWSAAPDAAFVRRLETAGFSVEEVIVKARGGRGARHVIWLATRL